MLNSYKLVFACSAAGLLGASARVVGAHAFYLLVTRGGELIITLRLRPAALLYDDFLDGGVFESIAGPQVAVHDGVDPRVLLQGALRYQLLLVVDDVGDRGNTCNDRVLSNLAMLGGAGIARELKHVLEVCIAALLRESATLLFQVWQCSCVAVLHRAAHIVPVVPAVVLDLRGR